MEEHRIREVRVRESKKRWGHQGVQLVIDLTYIEVGVDDNRELCPGGSTTNVQRSGQQDTRSKPSTES